MEALLANTLQELFSCSLDSATDSQIYEALLTITQKKMAAMPQNTGSKKLYYISAEFLIGKLLSNNLINLGLFEETRQVLTAHGHDLSNVEEAEPEPSLGNGGLGRLAACFLDSIATLGLPGDGVGLNYHEGLFRQTFRNHKQLESPNPWITPHSWLTETSRHFEVPFGGFTLRSTMYDIQIPGYKNGCNKLHLFDLDSVDDKIIQDGIRFDKTDIPHNLTLFLYPDDSDDQGRLLRLYQQYFMVSNAAQLILTEVKEKGYDLHDLPQHVAIQINDTHPTLVIPELIRLLLAEGFTMEEAVEAVRDTCAYTNHTILAEALEKWPASYLQQVVPHLMPIIRQLDRRVNETYRDPSVSIIDENDVVHMAHLDIHYSHAVNGVAALHTEILKESELRPFYTIYPEKFNNKTNGITFRRWLCHCNYPLTQMLKNTIGTGFLGNADELQKLMAFRDDKAVLQDLLSIKHSAKQELCRYLQRTQNLHLDPDSIFDIQVKRLHEYKRQQMNALYAIYKYRQIKAGHLPKRSITMIFGAKAAPAYVIAKDIIHLLLCLQTLINEDPQVSPWLNLIMVENYNVTKAEKLIPACDVSEQISLASKEASGTGNMKFMLNGAVTLGTQDGANVEIRQLVGEDNIYIFGKTPDEVIRLYADGSYHPANFLDEEVKALVDFIVSPQMLTIGDSENLHRLHQELVNKDWFMTLLDLKEYIVTKEQAFSDYEDRPSWAKKMLINIAQAGFFSSDRTIRQYNEDIWHL